MAPPSSNAKRQTADGKTKKSRRLFLFIFVGVVAIGGFFIVGRLLVRHATVRESIPPRPASERWPDELTESINKSENEAGSFLHAISGLKTLSRLYHANGLFNEAMQCYDGLQRLEPAEARWWHLESNILAGFGRLDEALPLQQHAVELAPRYVSARLRYGDILLKTNRLSEAAKTYGDVLRQDEGNPYALLGLAKCSIATGGWNEARDRLRTAIKLHPDFIGGLSLMASVAEHFGDQKEADSIRAAIGRREFTDLPDAWLEELWEDCYDPYRLSVAAVVINMAGDPARARHLLERAISLAPQSSSYHRQLGLMLSQGVDSLAARQHFEKAVSLSPGDADAWLLLVQLLTNMGDTAAAEQALAQGLSHCLDSASLHMERARRWNSTDHAQEAIVEFREAYRLNPAEPQALIEMASVLFKVNRGAEALAALQEALRIQPEQPMALATLMFYHIAAHDEPAALQWWSHVRNQPRTPPQTAAALKQSFLAQFGHSPP